MLFHYLFWLDSNFIVQTTLDYQSPNEWHYLISAELEVSELESYLQALQTTVNTTCIALRDSILKEMDVKRREQYLKNHPKTN